MKGNNGDAENEDRLNLPETGAEPPALCTPGNDE
jgi:hypothetical protein